MGTILMLVVYYEVLMELFTGISAVVLYLWIMHTFGEEFCERYAEHLNDELKNTRWASWDHISYLLFWPVLMIFRLNSVAEDIIAFAADSQDEEN